MFYELFSSKRISSKYCMATSKHWHLKGLLATSKWQRYPSLFIPAATMGKCINRSTTLIYSMWVTSSYQLFTIENTQFRQPHASYLNTLHKPSLQLQSNGIMPLIILEHQCYERTQYTLWVAVLTGTALWVILKPFKPCILSPKLHIHVLSAYAMFVGVLSHSIHTLGARHGGTSAHGEPPLVTP